MTIKTFSFLKGFGISMTAAALLLSASSTISGNHKISLDRADHPAKSADAISPSIFHPWGKAVLADLDPSIFHPWSTHPAVVADIDPSIFHPWSTHPPVVADIDPSIFHPWGGPTKAAAEFDPDIFHPWGKAGIDAQLS